MSVPKKTDTSSSATSFFGRLERSSVSYALRPDPDSLDDPLARLSGAEYGELEGVKVCRFESWDIPGIPSSSHLAADG